MGEVTRICVTCQVVKPLDDFYDDRRYRNGKQASCKDCTRARVKGPAAAELTAPLLDDAELPAAPALPGGECLRSLRVTLDEWAADGFQVNPADAMALEALARTVDVGQASMLRGGASALSQARTADLYHQALERVRKQKPEKLDDDDPITALLASISQPTLGN